MAWARRRSGRIFIRGDAEGRPDVLDIGVSDARRNISGAW